MLKWKFWIDVGGTFTDCLAESPNGQRLQTKVLSSGRIKGQIALFTNEFAFSIDDKDNPEKWIGHFDGLSIELFDDAGNQLAAATIEKSNRLPEVIGGLARFELSTAVPQIRHIAKSFEIVPPWAAPLTAIRELTNTAANDPIPDCEIRLGTTRGTNALLTRSGARTALVTTKGFRDFLSIGDQTRPHLFELTIRKPTPLFTTSIEVNERVLFDGTVEQIPDVEEVRKQLQQLKAAGIESVAVCLMHGYRFHEHEKIIGGVAREVGFANVRLSHEVAPLIKLIPRGETTVLDAYLNPVLADYLDGISDYLSHSSTLQLMTSSGGLVGREMFSGKDSVLSGPAGGVVGAAHVGTSHGFEKVIGFDMGGTSTDVSRYEGTFERDYETIKAGVRIMTPMLAIETVAAGGGSICKFDGTRLVVGPESAGADPGPACYGRGGPLTVTDLNLFLGRIAVQRFPFALNVDAVAQKLETLCETLRDAGFEYTPHALADGFLQIANHNMAAAIENISVGKGYDPRQYTLVTFGGAGSQHVCDVARRLNIRSIIDHPQSGILSAVGIAMANDSAHAAVAVLEPLDQFDQARLTNVFEQVEREAISRLHQSTNDETDDSSSIDVTHVANLRYTGTEPFLSIPMNTDWGTSELVDAFVAEHKRQFGYVQDRKIEWVAARAEATTGKSQKQVMERPIRFSPVTSENEQPFYFADQLSVAQKFDRENLEAGQLIVGPAIVASKLSTTVVDHSWAAKVLSDDSLLIEPVEVSEGSESADEDAEAILLDPVQLEIFNRNFSSIASRMGTALQKTSVSVNVKERLDFSCAIFTGTGDLVVNAPHIPVHLGAMSETVRNVIQRNHSIGPDDVFVTNNPYAGGSHLPDVTVVSPVFVESEITFWVASRSHHSEIGGSAPGSMPPDATTLGQEGVLIDNFQLIDSAGSHFESLRELLISGPFPSRAPDENIADVQAQVAANRTGAAELLRLVDQHGAPRVMANMKFIQAAAATKARTALSELPDGVFKFSDSLDNGATIRIAIEKRHDQIEFDFTGTDPVLNDNLNANPAIVASAIMYVMRLLMHDDIPLNEGVMEPVNIVLPACFLNPPTQADPANNPAIVGGNVETSQRIVDVLLGALGVAAASQGTMNNWLIGDRYFGFYETIGGGSGATATGPGADAVHVHMTNTRLTDPEVFESRYPVVLREFSIRTGSGGSGTHRGGDGMIREIEFTRPVTVSLLTNRRNCSPWGVGGGSSGAAGVNRLIRSTTANADSSNGEETIELESRCQIQAIPGDRLRLETPGGGGWSGKVQE